MLRISALPVLLCLCLSFGARAAVMMVPDTGSSGSISVTLVYDNAVLSPMTNTKVLLKMNTVTVDSAMTDNAGHCAFYNLQPAQYQCIPVCTKPWGGCNTADCQAIMMNFVHLNNFYLTGIRLWAGEVNGQAIQNPASLDALLIQKRYIGQISTFIPPVAIPGQPDWKYETYTLYIYGNESLTKQIKMLCTGDVNGSYYPTN